VQRQRFNIKLLTSPSYSTLLHHTPRSLHTTSNIKLHAPSTQHTSSSLHTPSNNYPLNEHRVATFPAGWMETRRGFPPRDPKRAKRGRRFCGQKVTEKVWQRIRQARMWKKRPVTLTRQEACPPPDWRRELRHARKGAEREERGGQGVANERRGRDAIRSRRAEGRSCEEAHGRSSCLALELCEPSELCEPLGLARKTCARTRCGSRARRAQRASQRRRGRAASESVGAEEARAARTRGNQRTHREVATPLFRFILGIECVWCVRPRPIK